MAASCVVCGVELSGKSYGFGNGAGQQFACAECYWRDRAEKAEVEIERVRRIGRADHALLLCYQGMHSELSQAVRYVIENGYLSNA